MNFYLSALILGLALGAMGWGIYLSLRIFNIPDITTDGSYTLGAAISAVHLAGGGNWLSASILAIIGGALAASGSLFTMWMLLKSITTGDVVFVFALVVGVLGAMPGIMLYYVAKILCIELYRSTVPLPATATTCCGSD